jgi:hypothetical protein
VCGGSRVCVSVHKYSMHFTSDVKVAEDAQKTLQVARTIYTRLITCLPIFVCYITGTIVRDQCNHLNVV